MQGRSVVLNLSTSEKANSRMSTFVVRLGVSDITGNHVIEIPEVYVRDELPISLRSTE